MRARSLALVALSVMSAACASAPRFPLREPLTVDTDLQSRRVGCRKDDQGKTVCAPQEYFSPLAWDGADNMLFRPLADLFAVEGSREAINVNALDDVPDSAWFTNRLGVRPIPLAELERAACSTEQLLDPASTQPGAWLIDKGKPNGASPGFRVNIEGKGRYMFKSDDPVPERPSAASVIGATVYHAVGFYTSCEQIVYFDPRLLKLKPGLSYTANFGGEQPFDQATLDALLAKLPRRKGLVRMQASAWIKGMPIGPFRYEGTRDDDPNDVVPHQHRRELRGGRLLAAWINHFDAREQNTMDTWLPDGKEADSPGKVLHYYLDTSDSLGSEWAWDSLSRRLGHSYVFDWADVSYDFVTLGIPQRPWDRVERRKGREIFGYFDVANFEPEAWKMEYPNPAFSRMTELDGAWMARILSRFTPEMVSALASYGKFSDPGNVSYLASVLEGRLVRILRRYLTRLSPISDLQVAGAAVCAVDLARRRRLQPTSSYRYRASLEDGTNLRVSTSDAGGLCVELPRSAPRESAPERYLRVRIQSSAATGPLVAHFYDLGARGYHLVGVERPDA
jgi:hypothetical protein